MLDPQDRTLLLTALRPPDGFVTDHVLATTFSLDLLTLLSVPLAFVNYRTSDSDGSPTNDPIAVLHGIRKMADRLTVFHNKGHIHAPAKYHILFEELETSTFAVLPPKQGFVFHPKVWVLRFRSRQDESQVLYRVLSLSRNLTDDRSWDTLVQFQGFVEAQRKLSFRANSGLAELIAALPHMANLAGSPVPSSRLKVLQDIARELQIVRFECPDDLEFTFLSFGLDGDRKRPEWPFPKAASRCLVVSPFLAEETVTKFGTISPQLTVVSRPDTLDRLAFESENPPTLYRLADGATDSTLDTESTSVECGESLHGLHAKVYLFECGWDAHLFVGSANATGAAFNGNVEFLVQLTARRSLLGLDKLFGDNESNFWKLLEQYRPVQLSESDNVRVALEEESDRVRRALVNGGWTLVASSATEDTYELHLLGQLPDLSDCTHLKEITAWSLAKPDSRLRLGRDNHILLGRFRPENLSAFLGFQITLANFEQTIARSFALKLELSGAPADRQDSVLQAIVARSEDLMRYLTMLLSDNTGPHPNAPSASQLSAVSLSATHQFGIESTLFESLLDALGRDPAVLDQMNETIQRLRTSPSADQLRLKEILTIWEPIWVVRQDLR